MSSLQAGNYRAFALSQLIDVTRLREEFRQRGVVSIDGLVHAEQAVALANELMARDDWLEIFNAGGQAYEMPETAYRALDDTQRERLATLITAAARDGLQYRYRSIRASEQPSERASRGLLLDKFVDFINSAEVRTLLREITGLAGVDFADGQGTDYRAGDFLTSHDDDVEGKNRLAAYVFGLTADWRADWGGLLLLERESTVDGFLPAFNVLRVFRVPQRHHVSMVVPWAEGRRLSVTGWLRSNGGHKAS